VEEALVSGRRRRSQSTPRCRGSSQRPKLCDWRWGWERSSTHVGAGQPGGGEVRRDTGGPDGRVAARSGGQPGGGEVGRMTGR
jgi:hypothetical protein